MNFLKKLQQIYKSFGNKNVLVNPYRESNDKLKSIFVHIPKCAGISIEESIFHEKIGHKRIELYKRYDIEKFQQYFKFTFVRNPWDRAVSAFHFLKSGGLHEIDAAWANQYLSSYNTFEEFALALKNENIRNTILGWQHFAPQSKYITIDNKIAVDFVGRLENIEHDFGIITDRLGIKAELKTKNKSDHLYYKEYYNEETKAIIADVYERDITLLNYSF